MSVDLTVTTKGQVTLRKEVLAHLGVEAGDRIVAELMPEGDVRLRAKPKAPVSSLFGLLARPGEKPASLDEIEDAARAGWAGER